MVKGVKDTRSEGPTILRVLINTYDGNDCLRKYGYIHDSVDFVTEYDNTTISINLKVK